MQVQTNISRIHCTGRPSVRKSRNSRDLQVQNQYFRDSLYLGGKPIPESCENFPDNPVQVPDPFLVHAHLAGIHAGSLFIQRPVQFQLYPGDPFMPVMGIGDEPSRIRLVQRHFPRAGEFLPEHSGKRPNPLLRTGQEGVRACPALCVPVIADTHKGAFLPGVVVSGAPMGVMVWQSMASFTGRVSKRTFIRS